MVSTIVVFSIPFFLSLLFTPFVRRIAIRSGTQDFPREPLKKHSAPTPLLGGVAIFFSFIISIITTVTVVRELFFAFCGHPDPLECGGAHEFTVAGGIVVAAAVLIIGGYLDDKYHLSPRFQIIAPILASIVVIAAGVGQDNITNPLYAILLSDDPLLHLKVWTLKVFSGEIVLFTDIFTFLWLFVLVYATKLLDGLNGLVSGIAVIGGIILFFTSMSLGQPLPAILALIFAGAYSGFLPYNFLGKIFLGEGGSTLAGFLLGVLALIGPAKISITFLILGIPILDLLWVMYERKFKAKKSPFKGDLRHLHFKLLTRGLSSRQAVALLWLISGTFGALGLFFQGLAHFALVVGLVVAMGVLLKVTAKREVYNSDQG